LLCCLAVAVAAAAATAQAAPAKLSIRRAPMADALTDLAGQTGVELLFDRKLVQGLYAPPIRGRLSANAALARILAGTGLEYRITHDGAFVVLAAPAASPSAVTGDGAISELLVTGRRTQNVDIRRNANDIQPYKIASHTDLETSHRDTIEEYLRAREPANAQVASPSQGIELSTRSAIDLRGFGSPATLVLVDGRRMPYVPSAQGEFNQADLNGIPLGAIERIETLTSTAGGIYGPSAVGGVVNVILRRDYRGAELAVTSGVTTRGDAAHARLEARLGFTPDHGATDVMLYAARTAAQPLYEDQRDYLVRARRIQFATAPLQYVGNASATNGIVVVSQSGPLTLDPEYGGTALNSSFTFLPLNFNGTAAERAAVLLANAGKIPLDLPGPDLLGPVTLGVAPRVSSGLVNVRRRFGPHVEVFIDGLVSENRGQAIGVNFGSVPNPVPPNAPGNPFGQYVKFRFPMPSNRDRGTGTTTTTRTTAGFIADLPGRWKVSGDYTIGRARYRTHLFSITTSPSFGYLQGSGLPGPGGLPAVDPLGDTATLFATAAAYRQTQTDRYVLVDQSRAASLRLAGPVMALPGGPLTATVLVEARRDRVPASLVLFEFFGQGVTFQLPERLQDVRSAYAELRAPIGRAVAGPSLLRGLELQVAIRNDRTTTTLPEDGSLFGPSNDRLVSIRNSATVYTVGARILPLPALMLRASLATGELPPTISQFQTQSVVHTDTSNGPVDPKRGDRRIGLDGTWTESIGGSHSVRPTHAQTLTLGVVLNPDGGGGPRVSLDYSRTLQTGEIVPFYLSAAQLLAAEADYPDRVIRAPLTTADVAAGYTAGRVTSLDTSVINAGRSVVETIDGRFDWRLPAVTWGDVRLYGAVTWQPTFREYGGPGRPVFSKVGYIDGPLEWRGNAGVEWTIGAVTANLNAQYYDGYSTLLADPAAPDNANRSASPVRVPPQTYVDLEVRRRFVVRDGESALPAVDVRFGIQNLFDKRPATVGFVGSPGYSYYGDARRRRVELTIAAQF
jgi:outer membrane receptor protein involved in Fe transport